MIPSPVVKIQIIGMKVCLRCKGKTLLSVFNKLLNTKSLLSMSSNVLPLSLKQTFPPIIWIFTGIKSRLTFKIFSTLFKSLKNTLKKLNFRMGLLILDHCACLLLRNRFDFEFELSRPQGLVKWQKVICASWFLVLFLFGFDNINVFVLFFLKSSFLLQKFSITEWMTDRGRGLWVAGSLDLG